MQETTEEVESPENLNELCLKCRNDCKQLKQVEIVSCPLFEAIESNKIEVVLTAKSGNTETQILKNRGYLNESTD